MKEKIGIYLMVVCLLFAVVITLGCIDNEDVEKETITITDQRGKEVTIPKNAKRIVTISVPAPALLFAIDGSGDRIVGMHPKSKKAMEEGILGEIDLNLKSVSSGFVKSGNDPNVEELLKLKPDVVIQWAHQGDDIIKPMEDAGIPVIGIKYGTQEDLETWITLFGKVLGKEDKAAELIEYHRSILSEITEKTNQIHGNKKPKVLYLPHGDQLETCGTGTYMQVYTEWTGAKNVAESITGHQVVSMEQIIAWNPDIIYIGNFDDLTPEEILNNEIEGQEWSEIAAVKTGKVYKIPAGGFRWDPPNQESPLMWKWLAEIHHLELFDYDIRQDMRDFYLKFYGHDLTKEQIDDILHCDMNNQQLSCCK